MCSLTSKEKEYFALRASALSDKELQIAVDKFRKQSAHYAASADYLNKILKRRKRLNAKIHTDAGGEI
jgi:hypothetical protein